MTFLNRLYKDHQSKSNRVKDMKKQLGNSISINRLQEMLNHSRSYDISPNVFMGIDGIDDAAYFRACIRKEIREEVLEDLIETKGIRRW